MRFLDALRGLDYRPRFCLLLIYKITWDPEGQKQFSVSPGFILEC